jgi:hypothetical protein
MKTIILILSIMVLVAVGTFAQDATPKTDVREGVQRARIHKGRKEGDLTNGETKALNKQQRHIRRTERRAKADGTVTSTEQMKLQRKQNRASRNIRKAKNNGVQN